MIFDAGISVIFRFRQFLTRPVNLCALKRNTTFHTSPVRSCLLSIYLSLCLGLLLPMFCAYVLNLFYPSNYYGYFDDLIMVFQMAFFFSYSVCSPKLLIVTFKQTQMDTIKSVDHRYLCPGFGQLASSSYLL